MIVKQDPELKSEKHEWLTRNSPQESKTVWSQNSNPPPPRLGPPRVRLVIRR